jgi:hypothetical protein
MTVTVHYCEPTNGHRMHHIIRMGRTAGWYLLVKNEGGGCARLRTYGPYASRTDAEAAIALAQEAYG